MPDILHHKTQFALILTLLLVSSGVTAQDMVLPDSLALTGIPVIKWVKQWPPADGKRQPRSLRSNFNAIVLGKRPPQLIKPVSVVAVSPADFWVVDQEMRSIFRVQDDVGEIPHFLQKPGFSFPSLVSICEEPSHDLLMTDSFEKKLLTVSPGKRKVAILNETLVLDQPTGIAWSRKTNEIWVVETNAHRVTVLNENGEIVRRVGTRGSEPGQFNYPTHLCIGANDLVYIVDAMNFRVQVFTLAGEQVSCFGKPGDASGYFARPKGIAVDSKGNIYVVDALFHAVQAFDLQGNYLGTVGRQGRGEGEFWMPSGIFIDPEDYLYVADTYNARIQVFRLGYGNN